MKKGIVIVFIAIYMIAAVLLFSACKDEKQDIICDDISFEYDGIAKKIFAENDINKDFSYRYVGEVFDYDSERPPVEPGKYKVVITNE